MRLMMLLPRCELLNPLLEPSGQHSAFQSICVPGLTQADTPIHSLNMLYNSRTMKVSRLCVHERIITSSNPTKYHTATQAATARNMVHPVGDKGTGSIFSQDLPQSMVAHQERFQSLVSRLDFPGQAKRKDNIDHCITVWSRL